MPMDQATAEFVKSMSGFAPRPWEDGTSAAGAVYPLPMLVMTAIDGGK